MMNNIVSIIIVFLISSLIGLSVVSIVDNRLSNISINMPAVNLPTQKITVQVTDEQDSGSSGSASSSASASPTFTLF